MKNMKIHCQPAKLLGLFEPPGDKSISHRAIMFGALAEGTSRFRHFLEAADCLGTLHAFQSLGVKIKHTLGEGCVEIEGVGLQGLKAPQQFIDVGNSGTTIRLLLGILAGQRFEATLTGDASIQKRPMQRVTKPLKQMGAQIKGRENGNFAPLTIRGGTLKGIEFDNKLRSAQVKSALLFAGLYADSPTRIRETIASRDHTERFLQAVGAPFQKKGEWLEIEKAKSLKPFEAMIPGDMSAAAFFVVGAAMTPGSEVTIENVNLNETRIGALEVLKRMGAQIQIVRESETPEPMGKIHIKGTRLKGTRISPQEIPSLIDELPILMVAMALAEGESLISGAEELRVKETDRIHSMVTNLNLVGAKVEELPDGCLFRGVEQLNGARVQSFDDHRTVMSLTIATLVMKGTLEIDNVESVSTSFPTFFEEFEKLKKS